MILKMEDIQNNIFTVKGLQMFLKQSVKKLLERQWKKLPKQKLKQHRQQHVGKKAVDKIVKMLSKSSDSKKVSNVQNVSKKKKKKKSYFCSQKIEWSRDKTKSKLNCEWRKK